MVPDGAADGVHVAALVLDDPGARPEDFALLVSPGGVPKPIPAGVVAVVTRASVSGKPPVPGIVIPDDRPWGEVLGAALADMGGYQGHGAVAHPYGNTMTWGLISGGGFQVNVAGERFSNEASG